MILVAPLLAVSAVLVPAPVANQVFALEVHELRPFYPGCVGSKGP